MTTAAAKTSGSPVVASPTSASVFPAPLRVGLVGVGVVGGSVAAILQRNAALISRRAGRAIVITAVSGRDQTKQRAVDLSAYRWEAECEALADAADVDVVVEMIGGAHGVALALARRTLAAGKSLVTANKAMIAQHGLALARMAEQANVALKYEAAVAGGVPIIKALSEGASANKIDRVYGILNGTCNYILTLMEREGVDFADALAQAQAKGYAEADPSFDIGGVDAAHKLAILAALSFGTCPDFDAVAVKGIGDIIAADIRQAQALGHHIRLIGLAEYDGNALYQSVQPCLVPHEHPLASVPGVLNAVVAEGNFVGRLFFEGAGAGGNPTASAIVADLVDIARGDYGLVFSMAVDRLESVSIADSGQRCGRYFVRLIVRDEVGVLADIAATMRDSRVSIESFIQHAEGEDSNSVVIALVTHRCASAAVVGALAHLALASYNLAKPMNMEILEL